MDKKSISKMSLNELKKLSFETLKIALGKFKNPNSKTVKRIEEILKNSDFQKSEFYICPRCRNRICPACYEKRILKL